MHWTQTPEGRERLSRMMRDQYAKGFRKATGKGSVTKKKAKTPMRRPPTHITPIPQPKRVHPGTHYVQEHALITALEENGFHDAAQFIKGWVARG